MLLIVATASLHSRRKRCRHQPSLLTTAIVCFLRKLDPSLAFFLILLIASRLALTWPACPCFKNQTAVCCFETQKPPFNLTVTVFSKHRLSVFMYGYCSNEYLYVYQYKMTSNLIFLKHTSINHSYIYLFVYEQIRNHTKLSSTFRNVPYVQCI